MRRAEEACTGSVQIKKSLLERRQRTAPCGPGCKRADFCRKAEKHDGVRRGSGTPPRSLTEPSYGAPLRAPCFMGRRAGLDLDHPLSVGAAKPALSEIPTAFKFV